MIVLEESDMIDAHSLEDMKLGDPRRIVAKVNIEGELLWGCKSEDESRRMSDIIVNGGFLALTLNERGANAFRYLEAEKRVRGVRVPYFVVKFKMSTLSGAPMMLGQFLFEITNFPHEALGLREGLCDRVYFRMDEQQDKRVESYDFLSAKEVEEVQSVLNGLAGLYPGYEQNITRMLSFLNK